MDGLSKILGEKKKNKLSQWKNTVNYSKINLNNNNNNNNNKSTQNMCTWETIT
jgi:hypothetical protein